MSQSAGNCRTRVYYCRYIEDMLVPSPKCTHSLTTGSTYLLLLAFCRAPPLREHRQQFYKTEKTVISGQSSRALMQQAQLGSLAKRRSVQSRVYEADDAT